MTCHVREALLFCHLYSKQRSYCNMKLYIKWLRLNSTIKIGQMFVCLSVCLFVCLQSLYVVLTLTVEDFMCVSHVGQPNIAALRNAVKADKPCLHVVLSYQNLHFVSTAHSQFIWLFPFTFEYTIRSYSIHMTSCTIRNIFIICVNDQPDAEFL